MTFILAILSLELIEKKSIKIGRNLSDRLIKNELGWEPKVGLTEGLQKTMSFYLTHKEHYWHD